MPTVGFNTVYGKHTVHIRICLNMFYCYYRHGKLLVAVFEFTMFTFVIAQVNIEPLSN